jgi:hypothetical protein
MAWLDPPCSRNPHDEAVVVRRAQWGTKPGHPLKEVTSKLGRAIVRCSLRPCLGQDASRRVRVGRVRSLAFFSILRLFRHQHHMENPNGLMVYKPSFSAAS